MYGSNINGLISTLTQFVSLFSIIEGGFTTAAVVATYDPIVKGESQRLNDILYTTKKTYMRIGGAITACVLILGSVYILFVESPLSYVHTYSLLLISVLTMASSLCFLSKYSVLLMGSNREYIQVILSFVARTITWIISMGLILKNAPIVLVYAINLLTVIVNCILAGSYEKKNYPDVTYCGTYDKSLIQGTGDVLLQKIANTIFTSTDLVLISVFINFAMASVYNLYYQVFRALLTFLTAVVQAPFNSFGQLVQTDEGKGKLQEYFEIYEHLVLMLSSIALTIAGIMIIPFVTIYTLHIKDCNYIYPSLAILFFSQIFMQIVNRPFGTLLNATGNFKMQNKQCLAAAIVNIVVSISFIKVWGIHSIIFGSFVATLVIVAANIVQVYKYILHGGMPRCVKNIVINYCVGCVLILFSFQMNWATQNYFQWIWQAILTSCVIGTVFIILNLIVDRKACFRVARYLIGIIQKKTNTTRSK